MNEQNEPLLKMTEAARRLGLSRGSAIRLLKNEQGCHAILIPGCKRHTYRVEPQVIERILRRTQPLQQPLTH